MPNSCSAPGCKSNYRHDDRIPCFRIPKAPPELRHAWIRALHREDIDKLNPRMTLYLYGFYVVGGFG